MKIMKQEISSCILLLYAAIYAFERYTYINKLTPCSLKLYNTFITYCLI